MFEKIIVASEIMNGEKQIIKCLSELRELGSEQCLLLQCLYEKESYIQTESYVKNIYATMMGEQKKMLQQKGFTVETRTIAGDMKSEINRIAEEEDYSLIVAAATEHTMAGELFFGGVAHEVIHHASKPVLLIRIFEGAEGLPQANVRECHLLDHILFPTDFSENANLTFEHVKKMVAAGTKKVTLVHIQDKSRIGTHLSDRLDEFNEKDTDRLNTLKTELKKIKDIDIDVKLSYGSPTAELLNLIQDLGISLVVMGSQGRGFIQDIYLGSVSHNIARHSSASVLLIPAKRN